MNNPPAAPVLLNGRSALLKLVGIVFLTVLMIVPLVLIAEVANERRMLAADAEENIKQGWGGVQTVAGPFLVVPYTLPEERDEQGRVTAPAQRGRAVVFAKTLKARAAPLVEIRQRGIFSVPVFAAEITLEGEVAQYPLHHVRPDAVPDWRQARLAIGIYDVRGLGADLNVMVDGQAGPSFDSGTGAQFSSSGISAPLDMSAGPRKISVRFTLRGTGRFNFVAAAEAFTAEVTSNWPHPSFDGAFLPQTRTLRSDGFSASWTISHLARSLPQVFDDQEMVTNTSGSMFGVSFYQPVDFYRLVERSLKYAVLFVGAAFLVLFLIETLSGARMHAVQYVFAGAAQAIFYLLLLALAEQTGFTIAYAAAAGACTLLSGLYAISIFRSFWRAGALMLALTVLYGLLYTLLNEEDYALLTGALAAFAALALTMFLTRKVDWHAAQDQAVTAVRAAGGEDAGSGTKD